MFFINRNVMKTLISSTRLFHFSSRLNIDPKTVDEIRIPVPWGHMAGKRWGDKASQPIIALHGLLDNSSTFDRLIPLIEAPSVLCLDLTGQGQSSHLPRGVSLYYMDNILQLRYIFKYIYKWDKNLIFLGHSFGSSLLFNYAAFFPEDVSKMINIDCARFRNAVNIKTFIKRTRNSADNFLNAENKYQIEGGFSFDDCVNHTLKTRESLKLPLSKECCEVICTRGTYSLGNGMFYFSHDRKLKDASFGRNTHASNLALASRIKCKVLNIHATGGINDGIYGIEEDKHMKIMGENSGSCVHLVLEGSHHIHLEAPEKVAPHINEFLNS